MNMMGLACGGFGVGRRRVGASRATRVQAIMFICVHPCEKHFGRRGRSGGRGLWRVVRRSLGFRGLRRL